MSRTSFLTTRRIPFLILGLALSAVIAACATDKVTGKKKLALVQWSVEQEQQMGNEYSPNFEAQFDGPYLDEAANDYLGKLIVEMSTHSVRKDDFEYKFSILNSSVPNAFALPGGYVYITRGLLQNLETEGQFISVMGHELGHVEHQHAMFAQNRQLFATLFLGIIGAGESMLSDDPDRPLYVTSALAVVAPVALLRYDRNQELEADARGVDFAYNMSYDPREGEKTFEYFKRLEAGSGSSTPVIFRTHPLNEDRIDKIREKVQHDYSQVLQRDAASFRPVKDGNRRFQEIVVKLRQKDSAYQGYDRAMALLSESADQAKGRQQAMQLLSTSLKAIPDEPLFILGIGEVQYAEQKGDRGLGRFREAASIYEKRGRGKSHWKPHFYTGAIQVDAGKSREAIASLKRAVTLFPMHPLPNYYLGRAEEANGNREAAAASYELVMQVTEPGSSLYKKAEENLNRLRGGA